MPLSPRGIVDLVSLVLQDLNVCSDEVILHFVTKRAIQKKHKDFFNDPTPTDCISFPIDPPLLSTPESSQTRNKGYHVLGEIFICPKVALEYAKEHPIDPSEELARYIIHGLLHLVGYDDIKKAERLRMRRMENRLLKIRLRKKCDIVDPSTQLTKFLPFGLT
jgi:probable rRNA maturation factor